MEVWSMLCGNLDGRGVGGEMDTCICMTESLRYLPETVITLLISYSLIQNKKFKRIKKSVKMVIFFLILSLGLFFIIS